MTPEPTSAAGPSSAEGVASAADVVRPSLSDPEYRQGVVELLGLLGAGEYLAFERLVTEAALAPSLSQRVRIADIAQGELGHFHLLRERLIEMGEDPDEAMSAFLGPLESYHRMTAPSDWLEGLVKAYVGDSISEDFYREVGAVLDEETAALVLEVCSELGKTAVVIEEVRAAIARDPRLAGRLALWGRRLLGEMLSQAQSVAAEHDGLAALILSEQVSSQIDLFGLVERLTAAHVERMNASGSGGVGAPRPAAFSPSVRGGTGLGRPLLLCRRWSGSAAAPCLGADEHACTRHCGCAADVPLGRAARRRLATDRPQIVPKPTLRTSAAAIST